MADNPMSSYIYASSAYGPRSTPSSNRYGPSSTHALSSAWPTEGPPFADVRESHLFSPPSNHFLSVPHVNESPFPVGAEGYHFNMAANRPFSPAPPLVFRPPPFSGSIEGSRFAYPSVLPPSFPFAEGTGSNLFGMRPYLGQHHANGIDLSTYRTAGNLDYEMERERFIIERGQAMAGSYFQQRNGSLPMSSPLDKASGAHFAFQPQLYAAEEKLYDISAGGGNPFERNRFTPPNMELSRVDQYPHSFGSWRDELTAHGAQVKPSFASPTHSNTLHDVPYTVPSQFANSNDSERLAFRDHSSSTPEGDRYCQDYGADTTQRLYPGVTSSLVHSGTQSNFAHLNPPSGNSFNTPVSTNPSFSGYSDADYGRNDTAPPPAHVHFPPTPQRSSLDGFETRLSPESFAEKPFDATHSPNYLLNASTGMMDANLTNQETGLHSLSQTRSALGDGQRFHDFNDNSHVAVTERNQLTHLMTDSSVLSPPQHNSRSPSESEWNRMHETNGDGLCEIKDASLQNSPVINNRCDVACGDDGIRPTLLQEPGFRFESRVLYPRSIVSSVKPDQRCNAMELRPQERSMFTMLSQNTGVYGSVVTPDSIDNEEVEKKYVVKTSCAATSPLANEPESLNHGNVYTQEFMKEYQEQSDSSTTSEYEPPSSYQVDGIVRKRKQTSTERSMTLRKRSMTKSLADDSDNDFEANQRNAQPRIRLVIKKVTTPAENETENTTSQRLKVAKTKTLRRGKQQRKPVNKSCPVCGKTFVRTDSLTVHMRVHTGVRPFHCEHCDASYKISSHLRDHVRSKHTNSRPFACENCGKTFTYSTSRRRHERICGKQLSERVRFECVCCEKCFVTSKGFAKHQNSCKMRKSGDGTIKDKVMSKGLVKQQRNCGMTDFGDGVVDKDEDTLFECSCGKSFTTFPGLDHHQHFFCTKKESQRSGLYVCQECGKCFEKRNRFVIHTRHHTGERPFKCPKCESSFYDKVSLDRHVDRHKGSKMLGCTLCEAAFYIKRSLSLHVMRVHCEMKRYQCNQCVSDFSSGYKLSRHVRQVHWVEKRFRCLLCDRAFLEASNWINHMRQHKMITQPNNHIRDSRNVQQHTCKLCHKSFVMRDIESLRVHVASEHPGAAVSEAITKETAKCDLCSKVFSCVESLRVHMWRHSGLKPLKCGQCGMAFVLKSSLLLHQRRHTDYRPHRLGQLFPSRPVTNHHQVIPERPAEDGVPKFNCSECGKSFKRQMCLNVHMKRHKEATAYICSDCGKDFVDLCRLKIHMSVHDGPKPFTCQSCPAGFFYQYLLDDHVKRKHTEQPRESWLCEECGKSLCRKDALQKHMARHEKHRDGSVPKVGRPKGTKSPPSFLIEDLVSGEETKKKRGRPKGWRKKDIVVNVNLIADTRVGGTNVEVPKGEGAVRKRGRPKGWRKKKAVVDVDAPLSHHQLPAANILVGFHNAEGVNKNRGCPKGWRKNKTVGESQKVVSQNKPVEEEVVDLTLLDETQPISTPFEGKEHSPDTHGEYEGRQNYPHHSNGLHEGQANSQYQNSLFDGQNYPHFQNGSLEGQLNYPQQLDSLSQSHNYPHYRNGSFQEQAYPPPTNSLSDPNRVLQGDNYPHYPNTYVHNSFPWQWR